MEKLIMELEELAAKFGNQGDRFQANGHFTEATEQFGRQFGVERALAKVREHLTSAATRSDTQAPWKMLQRRHSRLGSLPCRSR